MEKTCSAETAFALAVELFENQFCISLASAVVCATDDFQLEKKETKFLLVKCDKMYFSHTHA